MKYIFQILLGLACIVCSSSLQAQAVFNDTILFKFQDVRIGQGKIKYFGEMQPVDDKGDLASFQGVGTGIFSDMDFNDAFNDTIMYGRLSSPEELVGQNVRAIVSVRSRNALTIGRKRARVSFMREEENGEYTAFPDLWFSTTTKWIRD